jgi:Family of unknown function (DUF5681)
MTDPDGSAEETPRRYRNPPIEHRFRKGVSGDPRGRPRKSHALVSTARLPAQFAALRETTDRKMTGPPLTNGRP